MVGGGATQAPQPRPSGFMADTDILLGGFWTVWGAWRVLWQDQGKTHISRLCQVLMKMSHMSKNKKMFLHS